MRPLYRSSGGLTPVAISISLWHFHLVGNRRFSARRLCYTRRVSLVRSSSLVGFLHLLAVVSPMCPFVESSIWHSLLAVSLSWFHQWTALRSCIRLLFLSMSECHILLLHNGSCMFSTISDNACGISVSWLQGHADCTGLCAGRRSGLLSLGYRSACMRLTPSMSRVSLGMG